MQKRIIFSNQFVKQYKLAVKRGKNINKLKNIISLLEIGSLLPSKYKDHKLIGYFKGSRELYIEPDWLLIYKIDKNDIILQETGSHADLFE